VLVSRLESKTDRSLLSNSFAGIRSGEGQDEVLTLSGFKDVSSEPRRADGVGCLEAS
jgi:hypothetical protein